MKVQILDVDYVNVGEKPVVRIFGKDEKGETVCGFYQGFYPYFYAKGEGVEKLLKDETVVMSIEKVRKNLSVGFQGDTEVFKITLTNPAKTPELREMLVERGIECFEADILFKYRFMADMGIGGMRWVDMEGNPVKTSTVNSKHNIEIEKLTPLQMEADAPLKYFVFDIECISATGLMPDAKRDPVTMISICTNVPYKGEKEFVFSTRSGKGVRAFETEAEMLEEFLSFIMGYDADIISGYNINNFDLPYVIERLRQNNIKVVMGRCNSKQSTAIKIMSRFKINIVGRIVLDSFELVKKDFSLQRYSLDFVSNKLIGKKKVDVKYSEMEKLFKGDVEGYEKLVKYSIVDSRLALELVMKLQLMDKYIALAKVSGITLNDALSGGETIKIENFLLREFNKANFIFPCKPSKATVSKRIKDSQSELGGGYVKEPVRGLHSDVAVLDFKSMYPSIIITFNICPTTLVKGSERPKGINYIESPSGAVFVPPEVRKGIVPGILEQLLKARQDVKKEMGKYDKKDENFRLLYSKQWAIKILANAFYGYLGYVRAVIYDLSIANSITSYGRNIIQKTADFIEKEYGYKVIYGDTDSVFVKLDTDDMNKISDIASEIADRVTKDLPGVMELEFEKIFKRFLPLAKKRYVAWKFEGRKDNWKESIDMKGIETVRRDWCPLVGETMREAIDIILKKDDVKGAVKYLKGVINDLVTGKIDIQKLVITKTLTKPTGSYVGIQPHTELVKKVTQRNPADAPGIGDRISYVIIKGTQLLSKRSEDPSYVIEHGLQLDSNYYMENQLFPPLERIFNVLGVSKSELLGNGKQMGLFDIINNRSKESVKEKPKEVVIREIRHEEMNGFICIKCNKHYQRIPLLGACECGGRILFSSSHGPAETVSLA